MPSTVKLNTKGADALLAQKCLRNAGYYKYQLDGWFGPESIKALKRFQSKTGHTPDGVCGQKTWRDLLKFKPRDPTPTPTPTPVDMVNLEIPIDRQDDKCRCCPSTWFMILSYYKVPTSEDEVATLLGTSDTTNTGATCSGTPPSRIPGMIAAINKKYNRNFKVNNYYLADVGGLPGIKEKYIKNRIPVCLHTNPKAFTWTDYDGGHYVAMDGYKPGYSQINDPYWVNGSQVWEKDSNVASAVTLREGTGQKPRGVWVIWE